MRLTILLVTALFLSGNPVHAQTTGPQPMSSGSDDLTLFQQGYRRDITYPSHVVHLTKEVLLSTAWTLGGTRSSSVLIFYRNDVFRFGAIQSGPAIKGSYRIEKNGDVILETNRVLSDWGKSVRPFQHTIITLHFRTDLKDIMYHDGLIDDKTGVVFYAVGAVQPVGTHLRIDDVAVVKLSEQVVVTDHLRFRDKPSTSGRSLKVSYMCCGPLPITDFDFFLKGTILGAIARTTTKDNIGGLSDYWYYVEWIPFETPEFGWAYGAYLSPFEKSKVDSYDEMWSKDAASVSHQRPSN